MENKPETDQEFYDRIMAMDDDNPVPASELKDVLNVCESLVRQNLECMEIIKSQHERLNVHKKLLI